MKKIIAALLCLAVVCPAFAGAEEYYRYRIHDKYFAPFAPEFFGDDDAVYHAWGDRKGDISLDWHLLWYRGGELFRDHAYPAAGGFSSSLFLPREDGTCGVLLPDQKDEITGDGCVILYEWTDAGLETAETLPGTWQEKDIKRADGGFFAYDGTAGVLSCFDSHGKLLREIPMADRIPRTVIMGKRAMVRSPAPSEAWMGCARSFSGRKRAARSIPGTWRSAWTGRKKNGAGQIGRAHV